MAQEFNQRKFANTGDESAFASFSYNSFKTFWGSGCRFDFKLSGALCSNKLLVNRTIDNRVAKMNFA